MKFESAKSSAKEICSEKSVSKQALAPNLSDPFAVSQRITVTADSLSFTYFTWAM